jgi:DUF1680 family protein
MPFLIETFRPIHVLLAATTVVVGASAAAPASEGANLALVASSSTSYVSGHETIAALNDGATPENSNDKTHGAYGNWPRTGAQWVQYDWAKPISTARMDVYWFDDHNGVRLPKSCKASYWNGTDFVEVPGAAGLGLAENQFNTSTFPEITTSKLRLVFEGDGKFSTGLLEWRVYDSGKSPNFPPAVEAGVDRTVVKSRDTWLEGAAKDDAKPNPNLKYSWSRIAGPGIVDFSHPDRPATTARFSVPGRYELQFTADDGECRSSDVLEVTVDPLPPKVHARPVEMTAYQVSSSFWQPRIRALITHWIPYCVAKVSDPGLPEGGIENFTQAGNKLAGKPATHTGAPFANAWVYNTLESICLALTVDPGADTAVMQAQQSMRKTLEDWIPKILSAQEPDGYLQTMYTINGLPRWSNRADHEGYNGGYFIEAALAHYQMTGGKDTRLLDAARKWADCWCRNIGPAPKRPWYDGHQELEQALVRLARFVEEKEGAGAGRQYITLAKFLLDSRRDGDEYDQSHLPVIRQYEAVGHAVRAVYGYSGMTDIAMETGDLDYYGAVRSLWNSIVNRKYYVTGGVGSGETSEGFGKEYSLPNHSYCESCAGCGELFFQHKMHLAYQESRYADLFEETLYNAILGSVDLEGQNFTYTNPLDSEAKRYKWHVCPCCVGNIPRTLLRLPTWMYSAGKDSLHVNLYAGSRVSVGRVAGTDLEMEQSTDYPWNGKVSLTVNPAAPRRFALKLRIPNRNTSTLYTAVPSCDQLLSIKVNGAHAQPRVEQGYAVLQRRWRAGDRVELELPLPVQRITATPKIPFLTGRVALRYGPLIYNFESVDQKLDLALSTRSPLSTEWKPELLGGVFVIHGMSADGQRLMAIPNYARLNRGGRSIVWIKHD